MITKGSTSSGVAYPHKWANILTAPLSEGAVSTYLEALNPCITDKFVPTPMIIQSLLYFTLNPPNIPSHTPTPLSILYKIASLHPISSLMGQHTIPIYPRGKVDIPNWINYEADGEVERNIKKRMRKCEKVGIWDLVWESSGVSRTAERGRKRKKRRRGDSESESDSDDQEEEEEGRKRVSERGWVVLEWLVHIWEKDQEERGDYSTAFLSQLPKQGEMQIDNPTLPLQVLYSVLDSDSEKNNENEDATGERDNHEKGRVGKEEQRKREKTAGRLISLLINTANPLPTSTSTTTKPPFHPSTLTLSFLPLFRLPLPKLEKYLNILASSMDEREKSTLTHFLTHGIEDTAGIRSLRIRKRSNTDFVVDKNTNFPRPSIDYLFELLLLPPNQEEEEDDDEGKKGEKGERMGILKLVLVATYLQIEIETKMDEGWEKVQDKIWRKDFRRCMNDGGNGLSGVILKLIDQARTGTGTGSEE